MRTKCFWRIARRRLGPCAHEQHGVNALDIWVSWSADHWSAGKEIQLAFPKRNASIMLPVKRKYIEKSSDKRAFADKSLLLADFPEHDLKFRNSIGKYTYYICSRCQLRVGAQSVEDGIQCAVSLFNIKCQTATVEPETFQSAPLWELERCYLSPLGCNTTSVSVMSQLGP